MNPTLLELATRVLRDPLSLVESHEDSEAYAALAPRLLLLTALAAGTFGATVGSYRGGIQVFYAAAKAPVLLILPLLVALPAIRSLWAAGGTEVPMARLALGGLVGLARTALLAAACSPALWLLYSIGVDYHVAILLLAASLGLAALPGLHVLAMIHPGHGLARVVALACTVAVFGLLGAQSGWILRPFVARPTAEVALLRPVEADVFDALDTSAASAVGQYGQWEVEPTGALGKLRRGEE